MDLDYLVQPEFGLWSDNRYKNQRRHRYIVTCTQSEFFFTNKRLNVHLETNLIGQNKKENNTASTQKQKPFYINKGFNKQTQILKRQQVV